MSVILEITFPETKSVLTKVVCKYQDSLYEELEKSWQSILPTEENGTGKKSIQEMLNEPIWQLTNNILDFINKNPDMLISLKFGIDFKDLKSMNTIRE